MACGLVVHPACLAPLIWILLVTQETRATVHKRHSVKCARTGQAHREWIRGLGRTGSSGHRSSIFVAYVGGGWSEVDTQSGAKEGAWPCWLTIGPGEWPSHRDMV